MPQTNYVSPKRFELQSNCQLTIETGIAAFDKFKTEGVQCKIALDPQYEKLVNFKY